MHHCAGRVCCCLFSLLLDISATSSWAADTAPKGSAPAAYPIVAGFQRFYAGPGGDQVLGGQLLLGELNCISCHKPDSSLDGYLARKEAPILDGVGNRVRRGFLKRFLTDPQAAKPGTTMPQLFADLPEKERAENVEALVHFLASTGALKYEPTQKKLVASGRNLYHKVGCVACHGTRTIDGNADKVFATSVPLGNLKGKYSITSLKVFLENPHTVRPGGRMPGLLGAQEAADVANFLLQGVTAGAQPVNMTYSYFEGNYDRMPDFSKSKALATGPCAGFDLSLVHRAVHFAIKFDGFLQIDNEGDYKFHLTSDDGGKLLIDSKVVVDNDGVHPPQTKTGSVKLSKGTHPFQASLFNAEGGFELSVDIEGPGLSRQNVVPFVFLTEKGNPKPPPTKKEDEENFTPKKELVDKGRTLFTTVGCANCHTMKQAGKPLEAKLSAPLLAKLKGDGGCLDKKAAKGQPWYALANVQRAALQAALNASVPTKKPGAKELVVRTMTTFNCYACHERDKVGGPEGDVSKSFTTVQPEMGEEGRVPPSLNGAGAKLNTAYFKQILDKGAHERPYMHTRMPRFGDANVGYVVAAFETLDTAAPVVKVDFSIALTKVKTEGRYLVGDKALSCIKCHTFAGQKAEGVQGMDMTLMTQRLKHDWFYAYMINPTAYRPGTRMPSSWPNGQSPLPKILEGDSAKQIESVWLYLSDGTRAALPSGLKKNSIPLVPDKDAIIYRNFIEGAGTRAIGVGYPEHLNLAFDANDMRIAMIWQGAFMDAGRHWNGRGEGAEPPAGDNVLHFPAGPSFAVLAKAEDAWPTKSARDNGYHFKGYTLSDDQRPTFKYTFSDVKVEDFSNPVEGKKETTLRRTLTLSGGTSGDNIYFRAAVAGKIEDAGDGWFKIDGQWKMKIAGPAAPKIRKAGDKMELIVHVPLKDGGAKLVQEFAW